jgi:hypothetical protein
MIWIVIFTAAVGTGWLLGHGDTAANVRADSEAAPVDLLGAAVAASVFVLSPVAWPGTCLDVFAAAGALGGAVWIGNLPVKL